MEYDFFEVWVSINSKHSGFLVFADEEGFRLSDNCDVAFRFKTHQEAESSCLRFLPRCDVVFVIGVKIYA